MKNTIKLMLVLLFTGSFVLVLSAQPGEHQKPMHKMSGIPDLSEEQEKQIEDLRTELQKEILPIKSEMEVASAELKKLCIADSPDMGLINKTIDKIGEYRTTLQKLHIQNRMKIRALLTPEQRVQFDTRSFQRLQRHGMKNQRNMRRGMWGQGMKEGAPMPEPESEAPPEN